MCRRPRLRLCLGAHLERVNIFSVWGAFCAKSRISRRCCVRLSRVRHLRKGGHSADVGIRRGKMLTSELVRPKLRVQGANVSVEMVDEQDCALQKTAQELISLFQTHEGRS